jgi:hypothetical protein
MKLTKRSLAKLLVIPLVLISGGANAGLYCDSSSDKAWDYAQIFNVGTADDFTKHFLAYGEPKSGQPRHKAADFICKKGECVGFVNGLIAYGKVTNEYEDGKNFVVINDPKGPQVTISGCKEDPTF